MSQSFGSSSVFPENLRTGTKLVSLGDYRGLFAFNRSEIISKEVVN